MLLWVGARGTNSSVALWVDRNAALHANVGLVLRVFIEVCLQ